MSKGGITILVIASVVFLAIGFVVGQVVQATVNTPGSEDDPLVSQSYVEKLVGERTATLQTQIEELQAELDSIKNPNGTTSSTNTNTNTSTTDTNTNTNTSTTTTAKTVEVTSNSVNLRAEPSTSATILGSAAKGDKLTYVATQGDWYKVKLSNGTIAWVYSSLAKLY